MVNIFSFTPEPFWLLFWRKFSYILGPVLILLSHAGALLVLTTDLTLGAWIWGTGLYLIRMLAITAVYHRLLTHRAYRAPRALLHLGCLVAASAGQMGPSWWKAHHLEHHRHSDQLGDSHSPHQPRRGLQGLLWAQGGWLLSPSFFPETLPRDVERDRLLRWLDRLHFVPSLALAGISYGLGGWAYLAAYFLSTIVLFHAVQTVNSLGHLWGRQPFQVMDRSRNNPLVALLTLGEGWHNLHHAFPRSARHGFGLRNNRVELLPDPTYAVLRGLRALGLASQLVVPSGAQLLARRRQEPGVTNA
jgi:stearoyl-CoA desaturase (delta-9 desaturase)